MTIPVQQQAHTEDTAVTRIDLVLLLQEVGRPAQLDVSGQDVRGIDLMNCNLERAPLNVPGAIYGTEERSSEKRPT
jgi:hypothetical protein